MIEFLAMHEPSFRAWRKITRSMDGLSRWGRFRCFCWLCPMCLTPKWR